MADGRKNRRGLVLEGSSSSFIGDGPRLAAGSGAQAEIPGEDGARKLCKRCR